MSPNDWKFFCLAALIGGAYILADEWRRSRKLRRKVFANLDSAAENGCFAPSGYLDGMSPDEIAYDMCTSGGTDCEDIKPDALAPHVSAWLYTRGVL